MSKPAVGIQNGERHPWEWLAHRSEFWGDGRRITAQDRGLGLPETVADDDPIGVLGPLQDYLSLEVLAGAGAVLQGPRWLVDKLLRQFTADHEPINGGRRAEGGDGEVVQQVDGALGLKGPLIAIQEQGCSLTPRAKEGPQGFGPSCENEQFDVSLSDTFPECSRKWVVVCKSPWSDVLKSSFPGQRSNQSFPVRMWASGHSQQA